MSDRLPIRDNLCTNPENHKIHLCQLKAAEKLEEVDRLERDPIYVCNNCGNKANQLGALCAPGPLQP